MATDTFDVGAPNLSSKDVQNVRHSRPGLSSRNSAASSVRSNATGGQDRHDVVRILADQQILCTMCLLLTTF